MNPQQKHPHMRLVWDREEALERIFRGFAAWKKANYFAMQAADEKKRAERRARKLARQANCPTPSGLDGSGHD
jgi:hypothetical protein